MSDNVIHLDSDDDDENGMLVNLPFFSQFWKAGNFVAVVDSILRKSANSSNQLIS